MLHGKEQTSLEYEEYKLDISTFHDHLSFILENLRMMIGKEIVRYRDTDR